MCNVGCTFEAAVAKIREARHGMYDKRWPPGKRTHTYIPSPQRSGRTTLIVFVPPLLQLSGHHCNCHWRFFAGLGAGFFAAGFEVFDAGETLPLLEAAAVAGLPFAGADFTAKALAGALAGAFTGGLVGVLMGGFAPVLTAVLAGAFTAALPGTFTAALTGALA